MNDLNPEKCVVILGSGMSINELTDDQRSFIAKCPTRISVNKFAVFYKKAKIIPTHVYFLDNFSEAAVNFLRLIVKTLSEDKIKDITYLISPDYQVANSKIQLVLKSYYIRFINKTRRVFKLKKRSKLFYLSPYSRVEKLSVYDWKDSRNKWAFDSSDSLFHYRGSFTTVLNYISLNFRKHKIILAGVDFDSPGYFFQDELDKLNLKSSDWTTDITNKEKKHFSIIDYKGTKMDDLMPYVLDCLKNTGNEMLSFHDGYVVKKKWARLISNIKK